jgi:phospholipase/carboxylesterase
MPKKFSLSGKNYSPSNLVKPKKIILLLHGLGADGADLIDLAPFFSEKISDAIFFSPDAPFACDMAPFGRQWFSLQSRDEKSLYEGVQKAALILEKYIEELAQEYSLEKSDFAFIGFSQGAMLALHSSIRLNQEIAGVVAYSGALIAPEKLSSEAKSKPAICLIHGEKDEVVPFVAFEEALKNLQKNNFPVEAYSREDLAHGIDQAGMMIGREFLLKNI